MKAILLLFALSALAALPAAAQTAYPSRPVRLVVALAPGGAADTVARTFASAMSELWGQQMIVENRPGGGGVVASELVAKATPDGHTVFFCGLATALRPVLYRNLPFDTLRDFAVVSQIGSTPNVLVVNPSVPARTVGEFVAYAKANPGRLNYASPGVGLSPHLTMELFKSMAGVDIVHVPYKGLALAFPDLISGQVAAMFDNLPGSIAHIKAGRLRALGVSSARRSAQVPEVPTIAEGGLTGFDVTVWYAICAPSATPRPVLTKLNADMAKALDAPELRKRFSDQGVDPGATSMQYANAVLRSEINRWAKVVRDAGIPSQ